VVLENLLGNAWKYTSHHPTGRIEVGVSRPDGTPVYFVRDDGAGFDMTYERKLFGPFQRLHAADQFPGTGIGLATVKRIVQRHGGVVSATGAVEAGATFTFTLGEAQCEANK
jgi:light-regulated signal transduction histidine kinase (bacteriophytochrome)